MEPLSSDDLVAPVLVSFYVLFVIYVRAGAGGGEARNTHGQFAILQQSCSTEHTTGNNRKEQNVPGFISDVEMHANNRHRSS
jgi:hypothetical protein